MIKKLSTSENVRLTGQNSLDEELIEVIKIYDKFINENKANRRRDKFQAVKNYRGVISIKKLCLVLDLNRSSYYWWLKNPPHSPYNATWLAQIRQLYYDYNAIFGVRRLHAHLQRDFKTHLNPKTVHRYMRHLELKARIRTKKRACAAKRGWENLIKQQFVAKHPHQRLFTDVSHIKVNNKWCYISVVIDGFNAQIFHSKNYPFTLDMLEASINDKFTKEFKQNYEVFSKKRKSDARILTSKGKDFLKNHCSPLKQSLFHYYWWSSQGGWWLFGRDYSKND